MATPSFRTVSQQNKSPQALKSHAFSKAVNNSSQNMSLIPLRWAVSMGRVSTERGKKCVFAQFDRPTTNQSNVVCCLLKMNSTQPLVTWLITLLLIICPSSYKARPDNLICPNSSCFSPTERPQTQLPATKCLWAGLSLAGTQAKNSWHLLLVNVQEWRTSGLLPRDMFGGYSSQGPPWGH